MMNTHGSFQSPAMFSASWKEPVLTASCPMYRWQNPPILPSAYASAHRSSKRRWRSIEWSSSLFSAGSDGFGGASDFFLAAIVDGMGVSVLSEKENDCGSEMR